MDKPGLGQEWEAERRRWHLFVNEGLIRNRGCLTKQLGGSKSHAWEVTCRIKVLTTNVLGDLFLLVWEGSAFSHSRHFVLCSCGNLKGSPAVFIFPLRALSLKLSAGFLVFLDFICCCLAERLWAPLFQFGNREGYIEIFSLLPFVCAWPRAKLWGCRGVSRLAGVDGGTQQAGFSRTPEEARDRAIRYRFASTAEVGARGPLVKCEDTRGEQSSSRSSVGAYVNVIKR